MENNLCGCDGRSHVCGGCIRLWLYRRANLVLCRWMKKAKRKTKRKVNQYWPNFVCPFCGKKYVSNEEIDKYLPTEFRWCGCKGERNNAGIEDEVFRPETKV